MLTQKDGYELAIRALTRREHSRCELERKLVQKGLSAELAEAVLQSLQQQGWQCDQRFLASYLRVKVEAGWGPLKVQAALRLHGFTREQLHQAFEQQSIDWFAQAQQALSRRCREPLDPQDSRQRDKLLRFLCGRGFTYEQGREAYEQQLASTQ